MTSVNQRLAVHLLHTRGHTAIVVGNGREALAALVKEYAAAHGCGECSDARAAGAAAERCGGLPEVRPLRSSMQKRRKIVKTFSQGRPDWIPKGSLSGHSWRSD